MTRSSSSSPRRLLFLALTLALPWVAPAGSATAEKKVKGKVVPYVPTPMDAVQEMLRLGEVNRDDLVYDLGCGDGRIVNEAAKGRGARGVGFDVDPARIRESRANARHLGVEALVRFQRRDIFKVDLRPATVVTMYLLPEVNLKLRPKLLRELRPGTRVVSHAFSLGDWRPDEISEVTGKRIMLWVVPANVSGTWTEPGGAARYRLRLGQRFQDLSGELEVDGRPVRIERLELAGDRLLVQAQQRGAGGNTTIRAIGKVAGDRIEGWVRDPLAFAAWNARREPHTASAISGRR